MSSEWREKTSQPASRADLEAERERARGECAADPAEADDSQPCSAVHPQRPGDGVIPLALPHAAVESDDAAHEREEQRERAVGHLLDAVVGDVADPDASIGGCGRVHVVVADAAGRDDAERGQSFELGRSDGLVRADEKPDHVVTFPRRGGLLDLGEVADDRRDLLERVVGVADQDSHASPSP